MKLLEQACLRFLAFRGYVLVKTDKQKLTAAVTSAVADCIKTHGPITTHFIYSAAKRITGQVLTHLHNCSVKNNPGVVQWTEQRPSKSMVGGSIPPTRTNFTKEPTWTTPMKQTH